MNKTKLKRCPICDRKIDIEQNMYIADRDWKPTFYDPDSGGDPINIYCKCGLEFSTGTYDYEEFVNAWNTRKPIDDIVSQLENAESVKNFGSRNSGNLLIPLNDAIKIVRNAGKEVKP